MEDQKKLDQAIASRTTAERSVRGWKIGSIVLAICLILSYAGIFMVAFAGKQQLPSTPAVACLWTPVTFACVAKWQRKNVLAAAVIGFLVGFVVLIGISVITRNHSHS